MKRRIFAAFSVAIGLVMASCSNSDDPIPYVGGDYETPGAVEVIRADEQWHPVSDTTIWMSGSQGEYLLEVKSEGMRPANIVDVELYGSEKMAVTLIDSVPEDLEPYETVIKRYGPYPTDRRDTINYYKQRLKVEMPASPQMVHSIKFRIQTDWDIYGKRKVSDFTFMKN